MKNSEILVIINSVALIITLVISVTVGATGVFFISSFNAFLLGCNVTKMLTEGEAVEPQRNRSYHD